ncbi:MAG: hypothetical protein WCC92_09775 [Candidatus Korobacteraceae bacterium]
MKNSTNESVHGSNVRLQSLARNRADEQARRIPWQRLLEARNQYIDWQEFYQWVRSILDVENRIPDWVAEVLQNRCPGFLEAEKALTSRARRSRPLPLRLEDWIDDHVFAFAKQEGWFNAIAFYALRDPRYQRAEVCWSECVERWKKAKPLEYPSFEAWEALASRCDETAHLTARERKARASAKLVHPDRLADAVARYLDCEALAYWARHALERGSDPPAEVVRELEQRCPGYLEAGHKTRTQRSGDGEEHWQRLMLWAGDRFFQDAKSEGWFEAILVRVREHPRAIRTMEFSDYCSEIWSSDLPRPYPSFEQWRRDAASYVERAANAQN